MSTAAPSSARSGGRSTFAALYRLLLRMQVTPLRLVGIGALGALAILLGLLTRGDDDPVRATTELAIGYGLGIVLPLATLWLATSSMGLKPPAMRRLPSKVGGRSSNCMRGSLVTFSMPASRVAHWPSASSRSPTIWRDDRGSLRGALRARRPRV